MRGAATRFRVIADVTGVGLMALVFVAMPLDIFGHNHTPVAVIGPIHGMLYIVYLLCALDLARRCRWTIKRTVLVLLAGTIPVMTFVAERKVAGWVKAEANSEAAQRNSEAAHALPEQRSASEPVVK